MDKISELKEKLAKEYPDTNGVSFRQGFDAAMEVQLPVLFADWHIKLKLLHKGKFIAPWDNYAEYTTKELFDYWLENIW